MVQTIILGAGLSGMTAAINLAREGREVMVLEGAAQLGGLGGYHPSLHVTPMDNAYMSRYINFDVDPYCKPARLIFNTVTRHFFRAAAGFYMMVERGNRPTALDCGLYNECRRLGVKFAFNQHIRRPQDLPPGSIIATGLHQEMFEALKVPYVEHYGYSAYMEMDKPEFDKILFSFFDHYTKDYFYGVDANHLFYALLFSRCQIKDEDFAALKKQLKERTGLELSGWTYLSSAIPVKKFSNPRLFVGDKILTGTLSGSIDPFALFGIHGAMISGKIAAMAVTDRERALAEFKRINRFFPFMLFMRRIFLYLPYHLALARYLFEFSNLMAPVMGLLDRGVPGYNGHFMVPMLEKFEKVDLKEFRRTLKLE